MLKCNFLLTIENSEFQKGLRSLLKKTRDGSFPQEQGAETSLFHMHLKGLFIKILQCTHPQAIQDVDEFVSSSEQIWRYLALLAHQWILCS